MAITWSQLGEYKGVGRRTAKGRSDQTSRIHACCAIGEAGPSTWAEIARPQIHGYDMADIAWISPLRFASAGDEKVARVFDAPGGYVESLASLGVVGDAVTRDSVGAMVTDHREINNLTRSRAGRKAQQCRRSACRTALWAKVCRVHSCSSM